MYSCTGHRHGPNPARRKVTLAAFQLRLIQAEQFTATRFYTAQAKGDFGDQLLAFIAEGSPQKHFPQCFHRMLM